MKNLILQGIKFIGFSGVGWLLDFTTFTLLSLVSENVALNNSISSWIGVSFVFVFATRKVFQNNSKIPLKAKYILYILYQCGLIFLVSKLLAWINVLIVTHIAIAFVVHFSALIAKIIVTPFTLVVNFFVMKILVERI